MIAINVPSSPWSEQVITLAGFSYRFEFYFNTRDERWRMSIYLTDGTPVIEGVKVIEQSNLLGYHDLPDFRHGTILCLRFKNDDKPVGRHNLGRRKAYELIYVPYQ